MKFILVITPEKTFVCKPNMKLVSDKFGLSWNAMQKKIKTDGFFFCKKTSTVVRPVHDDSGICEIGQLL